MTRRIRLFSLGFLLLSLSFVLVGCGTDSKNTGSAVRDENGKITKLIVGTDATYAPMESMDANGKIVGIDIDIVNAIAEELGIEVEFKNVWLGTIIPGRR